MRITCDSTIEESVEANYRLAEMVGSVKRVLWTGLLMAPLIFLFTWLVIDSSTYGIVLGTGATLAFALYHVKSHGRMIRKQLRRMLVKSMGTDQPVETEFEVTEGRVAVRRMGQEFSTGWEGIVLVEEREDALELLMEPAGIVRIPRRIFRDPDEYAAWKSWIEERAGGGRPVSPA
jgi:hypothetical protein